MLLCKLYIFVSKMTISLLTFLHKNVNFLCKFTFLCKKWTQLDKFVLSFCTKMYNLHNNTYTKLVINVPKYSTDTIWKFFRFLYKE